LLGALDLSSGAITRVWGMKNRIPVEVFQHPDTKVDLINRTIPCWQEMLTLVQRAARSFNELRTAGWDVALTGGGIVVLESNSRYDLDGHQMVIMKGMRSRILASFNHVQGKDLTVDTARG